ncbi:MAG TPA: hypothetical protein VMW47_07490 [Verrucomicrobiae bacterium]|nr:hypothetical protein [Verrucomicrobiae bacterium]
MFLIPGGGRNRRGALGLRLGILVVVLVGTAVFHTNGGTARLLRLLLIPVVLVVVVGVGWLARVRLRGGAARGGGRGGGGPLS